MKDEYEERDRQRGVSDDKRPREYFAYLSPEEGLMAGGNYGCIDGWTELTLVEKSAYEQALQERDEALRNEQMSANAYFDLREEVKRLVYENGKNKSRRQEAEAEIELLKQATRPLVNERLIAMTKERDEALERYRSIELANKELTRNDHRTFGDLMNKLAAAEAEIARLNKRVIEVNGFLYEANALITKLVSALEKIAATDGLTYKGQIVERRDVQNIAKDALAEVAEWKAGK